MSTLASAAAAGAIDKLGDNVSKSATDAKAAKTAFNQSFGAAAIRGSITTTGNMVSDRFFTNSSQRQGWGNTLASGAISTVANYGASALTGAVMDPSDPRFEYSSALMTNITSMAATSMLSTGMNKMSGGNLNLDTGVNWAGALEIDTLAMVGRGISASYDQY
ncbi:MAG: hypothetical protein ACRCUT_09560, partial [Spirochaetota bacterium]